MRFGKQTALPILEYSGSHNFIRQVPEEILSEDKIIEMWETLAEEVIRTNIDCLWNCSIQTLRTYCTFDNAGRRIDLLAKENRDAASNYPPDLQDRINQKLLLIREMALTEEKNVLRNELQQLSAQNFTMDSTEILLTKLLRHPEPLEENKEKITRLITPILKLSGNNFLNSCGKIFFLCQKLGLKEEEESIRQKIIPVIKEALALLYPDNWFHIYSFLHLYEQVNLFGLTDQFKIDFLDILVIEFLDASVKDVSRSIDRLTSFWNSLSKLNAALSEEGNLRNAFVRALNALEGNVLKLTDFSQLLVLQSHLKIEIPTPSEIADSIARCAPLYGMNYNDIIRILELLDGQEARDLVIGSVINHTKAYDGRGGQNYSDWLEGISPFSNHLSENAKTMAQNHFNNLVQQYGDKQWHFFSANAFLSILIDVKQLGLTIPDPIINAISKNIEVVIKKPLSKTLSQEIKEWLYVLQACPFEQFPALQPLEDQQFPAN